jgi:hypothetical protein
MNLQKFCLGNVRQKEANRGDDKQRIQQGNVNKENSRKVQAM